MVVREQSVQGNRFGVGYAQHLPNRLGLLPADLPRRRIGLTKLKPVQLGQGPLRRAGLVRNALQAMYDPVGVFADPERVGSRSELIDYSRPQDRAEALDVISRPVI